MKFKFVIAKGKHNGIARNAESRIHKSMSETVLDRG